MSTVEIKTQFGRATRENAMLIANPRSGNARAVEMIAPVVEALSNRGYATLAFTTTCRGDATRLANEYGRDCRLVVVVGGDGTMNEVIRGVMSLEKTKRPVLGYIPMGSTNDFAGALGLPKRPDDQLEAALNGMPTDIDVGCFNGRHYAYLASFGAFTDISYSTPQDAKNALGFFAYLGGGMMNSIANIKPTHTSMFIDGRMIEGDFAFVSVSNAPSVVGVINYGRQRVDLNDGVFEVMTISYPENAIEVGKVAAALSTNDYDNEFIRVYSCSEVRFVLDTPVNWMLDGELVESGHEVRIQNVHSGVKIMLPRPDRERSWLLFE